MISHLNGKRLRTIRRFVYQATWVISRSKVVTESARPSKRVAHFLISGLLAVVAGSIALISPAPASAAACQGCIMVSVPTIGLNVIAQPGQQAVIDQHDGVAVYTPLTTGSVGGPGAVWLVGHRTTHGSVFNLVPTLTSGDFIDLIDDAGTHRYVVSRLLVASESAWQNQIDINDTSRSLLILQTSHPDSHLRYLVEAFGTGLVPPDVSTTAAAAEVPPPTTVTPIASPSIPSPSIPSPAPEARRLTKFGSIKSAV